MTHHTLPPLPKVESVGRQSHQGPTPWSNWVIPEYLIAGGFPASLDDAETDSTLTSILQHGINVFVCLQAEFSLSAVESDWRRGHALRVYLHDAQRLMARANKESSTKIKQRKLDFLHLSIRDGGITTDAALICLVDDCCSRLLRGEKLYIHCWGGHGRTGTLIAVILGRIYGLNADQALHYTQVSHDSRQNPQNISSPQTPSQIAQVRRLLADQQFRKPLFTPRNSIGAIQKSGSPIGSPKLVVKHGAEDLIKAALLDSFPSTTNSRPPVTQAYFHNNSARSFEMMQDIVNNSSPQLKTKSETSDEAHRRRSDYLSKWTPF